MFKEFRDFAMKGNLIDMAIGVVMGAAFGKITTAFIDGVFMPIVGTIFQIGDFKAYNIKLSEAVMDASGKETAPAVYIAMGDFVSTIINFIIVAFVMFMIVKGMNKMKKAEEAAPAAPSSTDTLLSEIRDLLKK